MVSRRAFLSGFSAATVSIGGCLGFGEDREVRSEYRYHASVTPTARVSNVTLRFPVPLRDGNVEFADALTGDAGIRPEDWSHAIVSTDRAPMLEVTIENLEPTDRTRSNWMSSPTSRSTPARHWSTSRHSSANRTCRRASATSPSGRVGRQTALLHLRERLLRTSRTGSSTEPGGCPDGVVSARGSGGTDEMGVELPRGTRWLR